MLSWIATLEFKSETSQRKILRITHQRAELHQNEIQVRNVETGKKFSKPDFSELNSTWDCSQERRLSLQSVKYWVRRD